MSLERKLSQETNHPRSAHGSTHLRQKIQSYTERKCTICVRAAHVRSCMHDTVIQRDVLYALQHKAVAQAVWKPEKYKETSHTTCCHYDNQAESFSLISCHSTQHRNPIAFKSYATRPPIHSARLLIHLQKKKRKKKKEKIHRCIRGFFWQLLGLSHFEGFFCCLERFWGARLGNFKG